VVALLRANRGSVDDRLLGALKPALGKELRRILRRVRPGR